MILDYLKPTDYLSYKEEVELLLLAKKGNLEAKERLITSNVKYIYSQAKKIAINGIPLDDLVMCGIYGLTKAIDLFDVTKNIRFITFATFWIRKEMFDTIYSMGILPKLSGTNARKAMKLRKENSVTSKQDLQLFNAASNYISLNATVSENENYTMMDLLEDKSFSLEDEFIQKEQFEQLYNALGNLSKVEQDVIIRHYGLFNHKSQTFEEIAKVQNKTRSRIHQIEKKARLKLKELIVA